MYKLKNSVRLRSEMRLQLRNVWITMWIRVGLGKYY